MPAVRKVSSLISPMQQSAIAPSMTTVGTRLTPKSAALLAVASCFMSSIEISQELQAIRLTSSTASSQQVQPAVNTSTFLFSAINSPLTRCTAPNRAAAIKRAASAPGQKAQSDRPEDGAIARQHSGHAGFGNSASPIPGEVNKRSNFTRYCLTISFPQQQRGARLPPFPTAAPFVTLISQPHSRSGQR